MTEHSVQCAECGRELGEEHDQPERTPCPDCGSLVRKHSLRVSSTVQVSGSVSAKVERGLNETRLAVLGLVVGVGLAVGLAVPGPWWERLLAGVGSAALVALLLGWGRSRHYLMAAMHRLTGR